MDMQLYADMLAELRPTAERLKHDDELNARIGVDAWSDDSPYLGTRLTCGLLRRVWATRSEPAP